MSDGMMKTEILVLYQQQRNAWQRLECMHDFRRNASMEQITREI